MYKGLTAGGVSLQKTMSKNPSLAFHNPCKPLPEAPEMCHAQILIKPKILRYQFKQMLEIGTRVGLMHHMTNYHRKPGII